MRLVKSSPRTLPKLMGSITCLLWRLTRRVLSKRWWNNVIFFLLQSADGLMRPFDTSRFEWDDGLDDAGPCVCHSRCRRGNELRRDYEVRFPTRITVVNLTTQIADTSSLWNIPLLYLILHQRATPYASSPSLLFSRRRSGNSVRSARVLDP
jgi:hypothetical protein